MPGASQLSRKTFASEQYKLIQNNKTSKIPVEGIPGGRLKQLAQRITYVYPRNGHRPHNTRTPENQEISKFKTFVSVVQGVSDELKYYARTTVGKRVDDDLKNRVNDAREYIEYIAFMQKQFALSRKEEKLATKRSTLWDGNTPRKPKLGEVEFSR